MASRLKQVRYKISDASSACSRSDKPVIANNLITAAHKVHSQARRRGLRRQVVHRHDNLQVFAAGRASTRPTGDLSSSSSSSPARRWPRLPPQLARRSPASPRRQSPTPISSTPASDGRKVGNSAGVPEELRPQHPEKWRRRTGRREQVTRAATAMAELRRRSRRLITRRAERQGAGQPLSPPTRRAQAVLLTPTAR